MGVAALLVLGEAPGIPGRTWPLSSVVTTIGRGDDCDVVLADREVSRRHAQIRREADAYVLVGMGSTNGTYRNGVLVTGAARLADGDEIRLAPRFVMRFVDTDATGVAAAPVGSIALNRATRDVTVSGRLLEPPLAPQQWALLELLAGDPSRVFGRDEIAARCYSGNPTGISDQAIDGIVRRLRSRLAEVEPHVRFVIAVRGHGFRLRE